MKASKFSGAQKAFIIKQQMKECRLPRYAEREDEPSRLYRADQKNGHGRRCNRHLFRCKIDKY